MKPDIQANVKKIFLDVVEDPRYKELVQNPTKSTSKQIQKLVVEKLYSIGVYTKIPRTIFKKSKIVQCSKEECEKFLGK